MAKAIEYAHLKDKLRSWRRGEHPLVSRTATPRDRRIVTAKLGRTEWRGEGACQGGWERGGAHLLDGADGGRAVRRLHRDIPRVRLESYCRQGPARTGEEAGGSVQ